MKSLFLATSNTRSEVEQVLSKLLPGQREPWLLLSAEGDPVAYFYWNDEGEIQADISGQHFNEDAMVRSVLENLQSHVGGEISDDN